MSSILIKSSKERLKMNLQQWNDLSKMIDRKLEAMLILTEVAPPEDFNLKEFNELLDSQIKLASLKAEIFREKAECSREHAFSQIYSTLVEYKRLPFKVSETLHYIAEPFKNYSTLFESIKNYLNKEK
jgi:uncharacterized membrane protein YgaE (UPF0421/DUF939 family)